VTLGVKQRNGRAVKHSRERSDRKISWPASPLEATVSLDSTCAADRSQDKPDVCRSEVKFDLWTSKGSNAHMLGDATALFGFGIGILLCDFVRFVR